MICRHWYWILLGPFYLLIYIEVCVDYGLESLMEFYKWSQKIDFCRLLTLMTSVNEFLFPFFSSPGSWSSSTHFINLFLPFYVYVSYSINISRRASARVKVSVSVHTHIYIYTYKYTVEGVCSRLIVDYHRGTCESMVGLVLLCIVVIKEERRE